MARLLALDVSTRTGWAIDDRLRLGVPESGLFRCPGSLGGRDEGYDFGRTFHAFEVWLRRFIEERRPDVIAKEEPLRLLHPKTRFGAKGKMEAALVTSQTTIRCLLGLDAVVEKVAFEFKIDCYDANVQKIKKYFVRGGAEKSEMMARCKLLGWDHGGDDNRADAMALWAYAKSISDPKFAPMTTPLFGRVHEGD